LDEFQGSDRRPGPSTPDQRFSEGNLGPVRRVSKTEFKATRSWNAAEPGMFFLLPMGDASLKCPNCGHETVEHYAAF
jgi:hypothetical protein